MAGAAGELRKGLEDLEISNRKQIKMQIAMSAGYPLENSNTIIILFTPKHVPGCIIVLIYRRAVHSSLFNLLLHFTTL